MINIKRAISKSIYQTKIFIMNIIPSELIEKAARIMAVIAARVIMRKVPAYGDFLKENGLTMKKIDSLNNFKKLPIMDKKNYFVKYGFIRTLAGKSINDSYGWEQSSNYDPESGFMLWPRFHENEKRCIKNLDFMLRYFFKCDQKKTLVIVSFVLGMWAAGERISRFAKKISEKENLQITVASPGPSRMAITELIKKVGKYYDQIILVGNPYFLRRAVEYGEKEGINWLAMDIKMLTSSEGFSEDWREFVVKKIADEKESHALIINRIMSVFGVTETSGSFATETPLSNLVRRLSGRNTHLKKMFFGDIDSLPMVFQYNPLENFLEIENGELIITKLTGQPLLRFNTHDIGKTLSFKEVMQVFEKSGYDAIKLLESEGYKKKDILPLPFFFIFGRNKNVLKVQGVAITIEKLQEYLAHTELIESNTGNFKASTINDECGTERLSLTIELADGINPTVELNEKYKDIFCSTNLGVKFFLKYYDGTLNEIEPLIDLVEKSQAPFSADEKPKHHYLKKD